MMSALVRQPKMGWESAAAVVCSVAVFAAGATLAVRGYNTETRETQSRFDAATLPQRAVMVEEGLGRFQLAAQPTVSCHDPLSEEKIRVATPQRAHDIERFVKENKWCAITLAR
jgi:hypothetical protein